MHSRAIIALSFIVLFSSAAHTQESANIEWSYKIDGGTVLRSTDGNKTWHSCNRLLYPARLVTWNHRWPKGVVVATDNQIYYSRNGGEVWFTPVSPDYSGFVYEKLISSPAEENVFLLTASHTTWRGGTTSVVWRSMDCGVQWNVAWLIYGTIDTVLFHPTEKGYMWYVVTCKNWNEAQEALRTADFVNGTPAGVWYSRSRGSNPIQFGMPDTMKEICATYLPPDGEIIIEGITSNGVLATYTYDQSAGVWKQFATSGTAIQEGGQKE